MLNPWGQPSVASGGFAATFKIESVTGDRYAVRCFHKQGQGDRNLADRYRHISNFFATHPEFGFLVPVVYEEKGITVGSDRFPIVRMQWAEGDTLGVWLEDWAAASRPDPTAIDTVRIGIAAAVDTLRRNGAAHGDLQHGNIIVGKDLSIRLIDYDGMYLPSMGQLQAIEQGHRNYQHPGRGNTFDADIDVFGAAVIDLSLRALRNQPTLWEDYGGTGENLIFTVADFIDPTTSQVFTSLTRIPDVAEDALRLQSACRGSFDQVPAVLAGQTITYPTSTHHSILADEVYASSERDPLIALQGQTVTVFGTIRFGIVTIGRGGRHVALLTLGNYKHGDFTIVGYDQIATELFEAYGARTRNNKRLLSKLHGWRVAITGTIVLFDNQGMLVPQIELARAGMLRNLTADKFSAFEKAATQRGKPIPQRRSAPGPQPQSTSRSPVTQPPSAKTASAPTAPPTAVTALNHDRDVTRAARLHELYKNHRPDPPPT
ncbi:hypothetical protein, partial [Nocardia noduli]|uniref:hypothetical protein n=1 Tax=Nocardia noduli TaxID=2815722 RepID=UPI001C24C145